MVHLAPPDETLDVREQDPVETPAPPLRFRPFFVVRSYGARLHFPLGWLLPHRRQLAYLFVGVLLFFLWRSGVFGLAGVDVDPHILPTAERFAAATGSFRVLREAEQLEATRSWDGTVKLEYVYQPDQPGQPSIWIVCWIDDDEEEARETMRRTYANTALDWGLFGAPRVGLVWLDEARPWTEESRVYRVEAEGRTLGYSLALRVGNKTVYAKLEGLALEERQLRRIFQPTILRLR